jgi:hypothetical protein
MKIGKTLILGSVLSVVGVSALASAKTLAQFNFDKSDDGQTFADISGNGHDAFYNRPVKLQAGDPFDAEGADSQDKSVVEATNNDASVTVAKLDKGETIDLSVNNKFTLEVWVNPSAYPSGKNVARVIQLQSKAGGTTQVFLGVDKEGKAIARVYAKGAGTKSFRGDSPLPLNKWSHLALVYDRSDGILYVDGKEVARAHAGRSMPKTLSSVTIGSHFLGALDDVRISDEALPADQLGLKKSFTGEGKETQGAAKKPAADRK